MHRIFAAVAVVLAATTAHAQQDFGPIKLKPGQQVQVIEDGLTLHGKVMSVAPDDLVVNDHHLKPGPGLRIDRDRGNTAWKGAGIGAAIGAIGVVTIVPGAFWGAVIGSGMDRYVQAYDSREWALVAPQLSMPVFTPADGESFDTLHLKTGSRVVVTQGDLSVSGTVRQLDAKRLEVGERLFEPNAKLTIEKEGDPIWDGAAIGFLVGMIAPHLVEEGCWMQSAMRCSMEAGLEFAAIGAVIDFFHKGHTTIYANGHRRGVFFR
ncbi:MAG TPA: hypothetical protein VFA27_16530 [Vicinamibacterales bacterium]|nr:hypothetical protein [Vicinamibacterales bacterium]